MNLLRQLRRLPAKAWNPETVAYRDRVLANGGSIADRSLDAIDKFVLDCKNGAVWDKLIEVGPFAGSNLNAALVKLVYPGGGQGTLANVNFAAGNYAETGANGGLLGDGATKYLNTGTAPQSLPDNGHYSFYLREDMGGVGNRSLLGSIVTVDQYWMGAISPAAGADLRYGQTATASLAGAVGKGFYIGTRTAANSLRLYKNGALAGSDTTVISHNKPNQPVYLWAFNTAGAAAAFLPNRGSFYSLGAALNDAEAMALHLAVRSLQENLNRSVN